MGHSKSKYEKGLIINDLHIPFHDPKAVELALMVGHEFEPDVIFVNGDALDNYEISRYLKSPKLHTKANLKEELAQGRAFFNDLRKRFQKARIVYIFGNHEYRWECYIIGHAQELYGLKGITLEEQLGCSELDIEVVNTGRKENSFLWGNLLIGHFDRVTKHSGNTARVLLEDKCISLIQAHTHRGGSAYRRLYDRDIVAYENYCLCNRNPEYVDRPNWQLGLSTVMNDGSHFHVTQHPIIVNEKGVYTTWFNGTEYRK